MEAGPRRSLDSINNRKAMGANAVVKYAIMDAPVRPNGGLAAITIVIPLTSTVLGGVVDVSGKRYSLPVATPAGNPTAAATSTSKAKGSSVARSALENASFLSLSGARAYSSTMLASPEATKDATIARARTVIAAIDMLLAPVEIFIRSRRS